MANKTWYNEIAEDACVFIYPNRSAHFGRACPQQTTAVNQSGPIYFKVNR